MIRIADLRDSTAVTRIVRSAFQRWVSVLGREPQPMRVDYIEAVGRKQVWVIENCCHQIVGAMKAYPYGEAFFVDVLAVEPEASHMGYGSRLLSHASLIAIKSDMKILRLKTVAVFLDNLVFYGRRGFCIVEQELYEQTPVLVLEKKLEICRSKVEVLAKVF